jgi:hypothetical protein
MQSARPRAVATQAAKTTPPKPQVFYTDVCKKRRELTQAAKVTPLAVGNEADVREKRRQATFRQ